MNQIHDNGTVEKLRLALRLWIFFVRIVLPGLKILQSCILSNHGKETGKNNKAYFIPIPTQHFSPNPLDKLCKTKPTDKNPYIYSTLKGKEKLSRKLWPSIPLILPKQLKQKDCLCRFLSNPIQYLNSDCTAVLVRLIQYPSTAYRFYEVNNRPIIKVY